MGAAMAESESRLSRWSRLKSKGGADAREEAAALDGNFGVPHGAIVTLPWLRLARAHQKGEEALGQQGQRVH